MNLMPNLVIGIGIKKKTIKDVDIEMNMGIIRVLRKIYKSEDMIEKGEVFIKGGVLLKPVVENDLLDLK